MPELRNIGKLVSVTGLQGELVLSHRLGKKTSLPGLRAIFLESPKKEMLPFFLEAVRARSAQEAILKIEGIQTREQARSWLQKEVWILEKDMQRLAARNQPLSLVGYSVLDAENNLGPVLEVIEQPHQLLCRLQVQDKEVLIPLSESTLLRVDDTLRQVHVRLPDGLLDIYLGA